MIRPLSAATFITFTVALLAAGGAMAQIAPEPEQIEELLKGPAEGPVVMVNLLRFKKEADAPDEGLSGQEAYGRYGAQMVQWVTSQGARLIWSGQVDSMVIGDTDEYFHAIALMEYPSRAEFLRIISDPRVAEYSVHRTAGLDMQWLIATTTTAELARAPSEEGADD
ncbi:MAG: DUF1330 domain-containing protein [Holophagales bacterium]|nr:DUF1330 domain-containing protein [Holophagales bacterium]MYC08571.1 DUF1330 domain-containing protein [Holophagales bacterium]